jgi:hypothetical protein
VGVTAPDRDIGEAVAVVVAVPRSTHESNRSLGRKLKWSDIDGSGVCDILIYLLILEVFFFVLRFGLSHKKTGLCL